MLDSCRKTSAHMLPHVNFNFDSHEAYGFDFSGVGQGILWKVCLLRKDLYCISYILKPVWSSKSYSLKSTRQFLLTLCFCHFGLRKKHAACTTV